MSFEAKYDGWCVECNDRIHIGDELAYVDGEVVHMECDTSSAPARIAEVCGKCWLTKPCDCEADQ